MTGLVSLTAEGPSDAVLITAVRRGDANAFGVLYARHLAAARRLAASLVAVVAERDDLVAEAFTRVLRALRGGHGPTDEFRPYLLVTLRNTVISRTHRSPQPVLYGTAPDQPTPITDEDPVGERAAADVAALAFATLPPRWRTVLWHTEVEGESPADIAPLLGMTPNGVSALAYRAREGLRQAYLRQHLPTLTQPNCRAVATQLAAWVRRRQPAHRMHRVSVHLDECSPCQALADSLTELNDDLPALLAPILLGVPTAAAYLTTTTASAGLAIAAKAGVATAPWVTALKTAVAGAMIVTTATVTSVASGPVSDAREPPVALAPPTPLHPATPTNPTRPHAPNPPAPSPGSTAAIPAAPTEPTITAAADPAVTDKQTAKTEKQAAKAATKADAKAAKVEAKAAKKAEKKAAKGK